MIHFKFLIFFLVVLYVSISIGQTKIEGTVFDENGNALSYVNIYLLNTLEGTMTKQSGEYSFITEATGKVKLIVSFVGYEKFEKEITLDRPIIKLAIMLEEKPVELNQAVVIGSSYSSEKEKGLVVSPIDVYTTPGGAADIFQSIKALPGVTQVSESAELYVRGGDPIETTTMIDQATIYHPYTYESSYGGLFSNLNTAAVKSLFFTSGGFSAKYGNALSGVLAVKTKDEPIDHGYNIGISMAAASLLAQVPITDDFGLNIYSQQSFTKPIMWLNGELDRYTNTPNSRDLTASASYKYSSTGRIKLLTLFAEDKEGVKVTQASYDGIFNGITANKLMNLNLTDVLFNSIIFESSLSLTTNKRDWELGVLDLTLKDNTYKIRTDIETHVAKNIKLLTGFELESRTESYIGKIPKEDYSYKPDAEFIFLNSDIKRERYGGYIEFEIANIFGIEKLSAIPGIRTDIFPEEDINWYDPRFAIGYKLSDYSVLKFATGFFHQIPDARLFTKEDGNPNLKPMKATHYILSYDWILTEDYSFRVEAYHKKYFDLPLENDVINYDNTGHGFANGIDVIYKGNFPFGIQGWLSYGYINTKRKWMDFDRFTNSTFDITHQLSLILKYYISSIWQVGINYKIATGRPFTPIVSSTYNSAKEYYEPVYGVTNSDRFPTYQRFDVRLTHFNMLFDKFSIIAYMEGLNILNLENIFGYSYSDDYSHRKEIVSYFGRRTVVFGIQVSF